jgi:hypothetical protein
LIRIFTHYLPTRLKNEPPVKVVSRIANSVFSFGINMNYTQHSLKCNLAPEAWCQVIKSLKFFGRNWTNTPSRLVSVLLSVSDLLLLKQIEPLYKRLNADTTIVEEENTASNNHRQSRSGVSGTFMSFSQASKPRSSSKLLRRSQIGGFKTLDEIEIDEKDEGMEEEDNISEEAEDSFEESSNQSSEHSSSESEEEKETIVLIDNALNPAGIKNDQLPSTNHRKSAKFSITTPVKPQIQHFRFPNSQIKSENESESDDNEKKPSSLSENEDQPVQPIPESQSKELSDFNNKSPITRKTGKVDKRNALNEIRLKKVNFNEKIRITTLTNTTTTDQLLKQISRESPQEWDNFDVYSGNNKLAVREVVSAFSTNFSRNIALAVTDDRGYSQLQLGMAAKYIIYNLAAGKSRHAKDCSAQHAPAFSMLNETRAKRKAKKILDKYLGLLEQLVNSYFNQVQIVESKAGFNTRLNTMKTIEEEGSPGSEARSNAKQRGKLHSESLVKYVFLGENIDLDTVEYLQENMKNYLQGFLNSNSSGLWMKCMEIGVLFDIPGNVILTNSSIKNWMVSLIINLILINRQFMIIKVELETKIDKILDRMKTVVEEAILHGRTYTVIIDLKRIQNWNLQSAAFTESLNDLLNFMSMTLEGTILDLYVASFLHTIVKRLWEEDYIKAMTYEDLLAQTQKLASSNINFLFIVDDADLYYMASYAQKFHPAFHSKAIVRVFPSLQPAAYFERSINWKLFKFANRSSPDAKTKTQSCLLTKRLDADSTTIKLRIWAQFLDFGAIKSKIKTPKLTFTVDKLAALVDTALCYKTYLDSYSRQKFEAATTSLQKIVCTVPDPAQLLNLTQIHAEDLATCLQDVCLPRILHQEDLVLQMLVDGLNLNALQLNLLSLIHTLFIDEYSFIPIIYDPQGFSISYFKQISKAVRQEHAFQYLDCKDCILNPTVFTSRVESGCKVILNISSITSLQKDLIITVLSELSKFYLGKSLGYYQSKAKIPPMKLSNLSVKFHNSFRFGVIVQKKADLISLMSMIFERSLESFVRLLPFEENLNSILINTKPVIKELETSKKQTEWVIHMNQHFHSDRHQTLFTNMGDLNVLFNIPDWVTSKTSTFINPDDSKVMLDYPVAIDTILSLNIHETSRPTSFTIEDSAKVVIQFKSHLSATSPFDSAYEEKYISFASKDLNSLYQKLLVYFSCLKQGQEAGIDANYLANKLFDCFDLLREALVQRNAFKMKTDAENKAFEEESRFRQALASERLVRYIEVQSPNFWTQLSLFFFSELSNCIMPEDFSYLKFWLWSNHSTFDSTQITKFIYSNTFVKRQTLSPSMSISKYINSEIELEQRDINIMVKQRHKKEPSASKSTSKFRGQSLPTNLDGSPETLRQLYGHLGHKYLDDLAVTMNPFEIVPQDTPEIVIKEESISEPDSPARPKMRRKMSDIVTEEQQVVTENRMSMLGQNFSKRNTLATPSPSTYKKSRFAQASISSSNFQSPIQQQPKEVDLPSEKKSHVSSNDGVRTPPLTDQLNNSENFGEPRRMSRNNLPKLKIITDVHHGELSTSMKNIPMPGEDSVVTKRKNTDIDEFSPNNSQMQRVTRQAFAIQLHEPEYPKEKTIKERSDEESHKQLEADLSRNLLFNPETFEPELKIESGYNTPKNPSFVDSVISPIRKSKMARRPTEAFNRKISFRLDTFKTRGSRSGSPSSSPLKSPLKSLRGQHSHEIPEDLIKSFNETIHPNLKRRILYLLNAVKDCDNFKIYVSCLRDLVQRFDDWKSFYEASQFSIYTSDYHLKLPLLRFDSKQTLLTYSETSNLLMLCRPFEIGPYFKSLPMANQYLFDTRPSLPVISKSSQFTLLVTRSDFFMDLADSLLQSTAVVHVFKPLANEDIEKFANEDKTIVLHGFSKLDPEIVEDFFTRAKALSQNRFKLVVPLKSDQKNKFLFNSLFDNLVENSMELSIKCLCNYLLRVESDIMFNTYAGKRPEKTDLIEITSKLEYDFSDEFKAIKDTVKELPKIVTSKLTDNEIIEVSYLQVLNNIAKSAAGSFSAIDENRTKLILYMLISISIKNMEENRKYRGHAWWLTLYDAVAVVNSLYRIVLFVKENSVVTLRKSIFHMLFFEGASSNATSPSICASKLKELFNSMFLPIYENSTTSIFKDNEVYRFSIKTIKVNYPEIFSTVAGFPQVDPNSFSLLTDRDVYLKSQQETVDLLTFVRFMISRKLFKVNFTSDLRLVTSKNSMVLKTEEQRSQAAYSVLESCKETAVFCSSKDNSKFENKMCLVLILNTLGEVTKVNSSKFLVTNNLIEVRLLMQTEGGSPLKKGKKSFGYHKKVSLRQTIHRKSILENFRVDMMRRFSIRNRMPNIDNLDGRDSTMLASNQIKRGIQGSISGLAGIVSAKASIMQARNDSIMSNKQGSMMMKPNIRVTRAASKFGSTYFLMDSGKLEFVSYSSSVRRDLFEKNKVLQSALWTQVLTLNQLISEIQKILSCKSEIYSGEISNFYGENEDFVINSLKEKVEFSLRPHSHDSSFLIGILKNISQQMLYKYLPISLSSVNYDQSFTTCWESLCRKVEYIQQLASRDDAQPTTGVYELNGFFRPINLFTCYMMQYSFKLNVN